MVADPVDSVMLTLYDSMNHKYKDSNASVTDPTEAVQIKPGSYRVRLLHITYVHNIIACFSDSSNNMGHAL
ncbi:hypothetical protein DPMN_092504 [Dreissena polymorpha]|uniref:Uncharacterized protein n=1 Tax=Dreissena polymorpha TaxID=45954 RepID=A0A9D4L2F1_DREPO|nr:hypothetical protein DPMN_092504 [Dreissena polymorpha]